MHDITTTRRKRVVVKPSWTNLSWVNWWELILLHKLNTFHFKILLVEAYINLPNYFFHNFNCWCSYSEIKNGISLLLHVRELKIFFKRNVETSYFCIKKDLPLYTARTWLKSARKSCSCCLGELLFCHLKNSFKMTDVSLLFVLMILNKQTTLIIWH